MIRLLMLSACTLLAAGWLLADRTSAAEPAPDFQRDIRPILSNLCYQCHGFDEAARAPPTSASISAPRRSNCTTATPRSSPANRTRASSFAGSSRPIPTSRCRPPRATRSSPMPSGTSSAAGSPPGAEYRDHWAFQPLRQPTTPAVAPHDVWPRNEIDAFILANSSGTSGRLLPKPTATR